MTALKDLSVAFFMLPRAIPSHTYFSHLLIVQHIQLWVIFQAFSSLKSATAALHSWIIDFIFTFSLSLNQNHSLSFFPLQYDYMERLDGKEKWSVVESPRERRSIQTVVLNEAVFVQYLDAGAWHLAFYNDGRERETVSFSTNIMGETKSASVVVDGGREKRERRERQVGR